MSGPWERYRTQGGGRQSAPWERYGADSGARVSALEAAGLGAADTALFGFSDELYGAGSGAVGALQGRDFGDAYRQSTADARRRRALAESQQGGAFLAGQIGGALVGGGALNAGGRLALRALPGAARAAQGTNWAGRMGLAAVSGGAGGALYGTGSGDASNRGQMALMYGGLGAAGGAAFSGLGSLIGPHVANAWRGMSPNRAAADLMGQALAREGLTDAQFAARLAEHAGENRGGMVLDALGRSGADVAMGASRRPSTGVNTLRSAMDARNQAVGPRAEREVWEELVGGAPEDVARFITRMEGVKRTEAAPLYAAAWEQIGRVDPARMQATIGETIRRHPAIFQPAIERARAMSLADTGREIGDLTDPRYYHYLLQGAERELGARLRAAAFGHRDGFAGGEAAIYSRAVRQLNDQIRRQFGPTFRRAQDTYSAAASAQDAAELGYAAVVGKLNSLELGLVAQRFARMSATDQQAFRAAAANNLQDAIANATRTGANRSDALRNIIGTEGKRRVLERIFGQRGLDTLLRRFDYDRELLQNSIRTGIDVNSITSSALAAERSQAATLGAPSSVGGVVNRLLGPQLQRAAERQGEAVSDRVLSLMAMPAGDALRLMNQPARRGLLSRARGTPAERLFYDARARRNDIMDFRQRAFINSLFGGAYAGAFSQGAGDYAGANR